MIQHIRCIYTVFFGYQSEIELLQLIFKSESGTTC